MTVKIELYTAEYKGKKRLLGQENLNLERILSCCTDSPVFKQKFLFEPIGEVKKRLVYWFDELIFCLVRRSGEDEVQTYDYVNKLELFGPVFVSSVKISEEDCQVLCVYLANTLFTEKIE